MRIIKFRVWDKPCGKMRKWSWIRSCEYPFFSDEYGTDLLDDRQFKLMQFTGLLDMYGNEIYEGDIVETPDGLFRVEFSNGAFRCEGIDIDSGAYLDVYADSDMDTICEVVGNIYENPDLLE